MVHIKKITVKNFKSFAGQVNLTFQPGFNIITGPNGSGKSNIIDAVQFVLGELGSKRLRVPDLSGLIYDGAGNQSQNRSQIAQVTLYFDNTERRIPEDRKTVSVGRKINRDGNSDYYINGKKTSRRNVVELLDMAGIAAGGYNIVLQGTATRLSDLTPTERMNALEDLVGITEYDEKKASAKVRLTEAERKIEVATARIEEIKKQVNELERQRNEALRYNILDKEEKRLNALGLSLELEQLEEKLIEINSQIKEKEEEIKLIEEERKKYDDEHSSAQKRLDEFNREAAERGNTKLPLLRSEQVGKRSLKESLINRLNEIENRKKQLNLLIQEKEQEIETTQKDITVRKQELVKFDLTKTQLNEEYKLKTHELQELETTITNARETAESNQKLMESLTDSLVPMQESLTGIETEINRHIISGDNIKNKINDFIERRKSYEERRKSLVDKINEYESLKNDEAKKLEDLINTLDNQVKRQRNIRNTIENANLLAKEAETTITEFTAKRDLWDNFVTEEKALARILEIGEAGALDGYHGKLRSLIKIDLQNQRAVNSSSKGWINAVIVDDFDVAKNCVDRLKKTKIGMTRFIPLNNLYEPEELPVFKEKGVIGAIPELIRYDEIYTRAVHLIWGDTYIVDNTESANIVTRNGYRAVTKSGDVFEPEGGIIGGYYRRPPDYSKIIPTENTIKNLSVTIRSLRRKLKSRMKELRDSGVDLRKFASFMDDSQERIKRIESDMQGTNESIQRLDRNLNLLEENLEKTKKELDNENRLRKILIERKKNTLSQIDKTKERISQLKEVKLSDVASLEITRNKLNNTITSIQKQISELENDKNIQTGFVERILALKIKEANETIQLSKEEIQNLNEEKIETQNSVEEIEKDIQELESILSDVTSEVEATTKIFEQHQKTLRQISDRINRCDRRTTEVERRVGQLSLEKERLRLQSEQKIDELARIGYPDKIETEGIINSQIRRRLQRIKSEKRSLGAINQLAIENYPILMNEYKHRSTRINGMEEEKRSILKFIEEIEHEKTEHFMSAYNQICENFSTIFTKLSGGGDGLLELQKPEAPFSGGVDLYIQFPGKPMRLAGGASGGERSVAAIAYLLAIQRFLKAPFYLFDEIDAHLDDLNTSRLSEVLKENSLDSQFLMVSLKDVMVHNADRIYGVFSQNGQSRVLALPMREARVAA